MLYVIEKKINQKRNFQDETKPLKEKYQGQKKNMRRYTEITTKIEKI
jgi:hypothetical protein